MRLNEDGIDLLLTFDWPLLAFDSDVEVPSFICNKKIKLTNKSQGQLTVDSTDENYVYLQKNGSLIKIELKCLEVMRECFLNDTEPAEGALDKEVPVTEIIQK